MNHSNPYVISPGYISASRHTIAGGDASTYTYKWSNYDDTNVLSYISDLQNQVNDVESSMATKQWVEGQGYLTEHQDLSDYATVNYVDATVDEIPLTAEQMNELFPIE